MEEYVKERNRLHANDLHPVCYIPRVEAKERECWKFFDWRLNSENESRINGQPSIVDHFHLFITRLWMSLYVTHVSEVDQSLCVNFIWDLIACCVEVDGCSRFYVVDYKSCVH